MTSSSKSRTPRRPGKVRSLSPDEWPVADQSAWAATCQPSERLKPGGAASHLKDITRRDLVRRYGYFLDHVQRTEGVEQNAQAAAYVDPNRADRFRAELQARVSSVTVYGSIYKLRRMAQLLVPDRDFTWLMEFENDLGFVMLPKSKFGRTVYTQVLIEAGLKLMAQADAPTHRSALSRARQFRDGLMVTMLALHPIRLKNFAALESGRTFKRVNGAWWIVLSGSETKENRPDERIVDPFLTRWIDRYLDTHHPVLAKGNVAPKALWLSSNDGNAMTYLGIENVISKTTLETIGVDVSPHLFRTAGVSTAAAYAGANPNLGSALLHHIDTTIAEQNYNRARSLSATKAFGEFVKGLKTQHVSQCAPPLIQSICR